jgi:HEAT repeat protein
VQTLLETLTDANASIRLLAVHALGKFEARPPEVTEALQKAALDSDAQVREAAALILAR